jgi:hypothetical protein
MYIAPELLFAVPVLKAISPLIPVVPLLEDNKYIEPLDVAKDPPVWIMTVPPVLL